MQIKPDQKPPRDPSWKECRGGFSAGVQKLCRRGKTRHCHVVAHKLSPRKTRGTQRFDHGSLLGDRVRSCNGKDRLLCKKHNLHQPHRHRMRAERSGQKVHDRIAFRVPSTLRRNRTCCKDVRHFQGTAGWVRPIQGRTLFFAMLHHFPHAASGIRHQHGSESDAAHPGFVPIFYAGMPCKLARKQCHFLVYCPIFAV